MIVAAQADKKSRADSKHKEEIFSPVSLALAAKALALVKSTRADRKRKL
jgi:hypothetical protein